MRYDERVSAEKQLLISEALVKPGASGADAVARLIADLGQPSTLSAVGVNREQLGFIADAALKSRWVQTNPRPFSRRDGGAPRSGVLIPDIVAREKVGAILAGLVAPAKGRIRSPAL